MGCWSELLFWWWNPKGKCFRYEVFPPESLAVTKRRTSWCIKTVSPLSENTPAGNEPQIRAMSFFLGIKIVVFSPINILENKILMEPCKHCGKKNTHLGFLNVRILTAITQAHNLWKVSLYTTYRKGLHEESKYGFTEVEIMYSSQPT